MQFEAAAPIRRKLGPASGLFALVVALAPPALAHHSAAMFDANKTEFVKGTVKRFLWTNPHSLLIVSVPSPAGATVEYAFEANGPGYLARNGWKRESLKPGDMVTVEANPLHDGTPGGNLIEVTFVDGRKLSARITAGTTYGAQPAPGASK